MEWIFRYALRKRRKKAFIKRLISAFHKSFSVFGFWLLAFGFWLLAFGFSFLFFFSFFCFLYPVSTGTQCAGGFYRVNEYPFLRGD
ncbi:hypothetical protein [Hungatella hathewayi]|uniref:hypothetical protein n=1 Tax=Hungatella hathewayi TaxID=154046 RepID=UPI0006E2BDAC|nr:hypothetical protein [Hungatella hathewayi]